MAEKCKCGYTDKGDCMLCESEPLLVTPKDAFEKLTQLQLKIGYKPGEVNPIALLGLYGEAGEILAETVFTSTIDRPEEVRVAAVDFAHVVDTLKKLIRDDKQQRTVSVNVLREELFDIEVADALYYINAIAIGRGKTLADYAEISYKKVSAKTQIKVD